VNALTDAQLGMLREALDKNLLAKFGDGPQKGTSYFPITSAIRQANRIFGHGNWHYVIVKSEVTALPATTKAYEAKDGKPARPGKEGFIGAARVEILLTACGVTYPGIGLCKSLWQQDEVDAKEIQDYLRTHGFVGSATKVTREMKQLGLTCKRVKKARQLIKVYSGIRVATE
jgi:hypothetical protein